MRTLIDSMPLSVPLEIRAKLGHSAREDVLALCAEIEALEAQLRKWTHVAERLPDDGVRVLVATPRSRAAGVWSYAIAQHYRGEGWYCAHDAERISRRHGAEPLWWRPLPDAPPEHATVRMA